jgi:hypothetical protein
MSRARAFFKVREGKVTWLYMPQRASQRKFGKSLKLHLAKQKKQKLEQSNATVSFLQKGSISRPTLKTAAGRRDVRTLYADTKDLVRARPLSSAS